MVMIYSDGLQSSEEEDVPGLNGQETKAALMRRILQHVRSELQHVERLLDASDEAASIDSDDWQAADQDQSLSTTGAYGIQRRTLDGVFDGQQMVGEDGNAYAVPPNYASKSKLVEGDLLRLTITDGGRFIFKQKGPIERQRCLGMLLYDEQMGEWQVGANGSRYRVLPASVSYYKGEPGDEVVILVPKNAPSKWAAVENIIHLSNAE